MNDDIEFANVACKTCGNDMVRQDCHNCGGEGGFDADDLMEEDPLWYDEDSYEACSNCRGRGYFIWCRECAQAERLKGKG